MATRTTSSYVLFVALEVWKLVVALLFAGLLGRWQLFGTGLFPVLTQMAKFFHSGCSALLFLTVRTDKHVLVMNHLGERNDY